MLTAEGFVPVRANAEIGGGEWLDVAYVYGTEAVTRIMTESKVDQKHPEFAKAHPVVRIAKVLITEKT